MKTQFDLISDDREHPSPGQTNEAHPELFTNIPPQPEVLKQGQISEEKVKQFFDQVFVATTICINYILLKREIICL